MNLKKLPDCVIVFYKWLSIKLLSVIFLQITILLFFVSINSYAGDVIILDKNHYSKVLGEIRNYRIFLPAGYYENPGKRYPVIYYYHGWSQRYFGSINDFKADEGDSNGGDNIANFVATHEVIVVKPDGYNRRPGEDYYLRPYNIGPVETYRQFPLYFPELVEYIDNHYSTIANRENRAITGLSMGGFMTFWIGGKYPHLVSAAGNFCGSVEFVVGSKNSPVEYRHLDMYKNYDGVNVRLNYGNEDFIRDYHKDLNKIWPQVMDNYVYKVYNAAHSACGLGEMFDFCLKTFEKPLPKPSVWSHIDVYPAFEVWDYHVNSDRNVPGFTNLEKVNENGFRCSVRSFLPDGELMPFVQLSVVTPPIYEKEKLYEIRDINSVSGKSSIYTLKSDLEGRLKIYLDGGLHEVGINKNKGAANVVVSSFNVENQPWACTGESIEISVKLLNKGFGTAGKVSAKLVSARKSAEVLSHVANFGNIEPGEIQKCDKTFSVGVKADSIEIERFKLVITDESGNEWIDFIDIYLRNERDEISDYIVADGKVCDVAAAGDDTVSVFLGKGNGDGIANPGESVVILAKNNGRNFRTFLHTSDLFVNPAGIHLRESDSWGTYDHVGGSAKYSIPVIASEIPVDHTIQFFAEYWLPDYPEHLINRGVINLKVVGEDDTPPELHWVQVLGDNTVQAKLYDGGSISKVTVKFILNDDQTKSFEVELFDDGNSGDRAKDDLVFSKKIEETGFGLYKIVITATDIFENSMEKEWHELMVIH